MATITTTLLPSNTLQIQRTTCNPALAGVVDSVYVNTFGCSSVAVITTTLLPSDTVQIQRSSCNQAQAGVVDSVYVNASGCLVVDPAGCKTLYITNIAYTAPVVGSITDTLCTGDSLWINGVAYFAGNPNGTEVLISEVSGCDSAIVSIDLFFADIDASLSLVNPDCNQDEGIIVIETINGLQPPYLYRFDNDPIISFDTLPYALIYPWAPMTYTFLARVHATGHNPCYTCPELLFQPTQTMLVSLLATDSAGCTADDSVLITVSVNRLVFLPNVFNPERTDGLNDVFFVSAAEGQVSRIIDFQIYDRWGAQVFGRKNILPNDRSQGWDGTYLGDEMMPGVYVYYVEVEYADGATEVLEGDLTLIR
jgi:gliding motility-associated-like protein